MTNPSARAAREGKTIGLMVALYCHGKHGSDGLCQDCEELLSYSIKRLEACPLQADKPTCLRCQIHCYKPAMRDKVREVMVYSGPRMLFRHPLLALQHLSDERRGPQSRPARI
jgi:hypothetical protein